MADILKFSSAPIALMNKPIKQVVEMAERNPDVGLWIGENISKIRALHSGVNENMARAKNAGLGT